MSSQRSMFIFILLPFFLFGNFIPISNSVSNDDGSLSLVFMGDIVIDGVMEERVNSQGAMYPFEEIISHIKDADLRFANLEAPISDRGMAEEGKYATFRTEPGGETALTTAGIDVVSLSNNHCLDYGPEALNDTMEILDTEGIAHAGIWNGNDIINSTLTRPLILNRNGLRVGFLAYTENVRDHWKASDSYPGPLPLDMELMEKDIVYSRDRVDILVVSIHWRKWPQYTAGPEEADKDLCRQLIDLDVDIIMGHGPHTVHEIEHYNDGLILYSLGNVAMNAGNRSSYGSYIAKIQLTGDDIQELELIPIRRETYRYLPMGTPIYRDQVTGFNISYEQVWEMYEIDTYDVIGEEDGLNELKIILQDSPWYLKLLLTFALLLLILLFILVVMSIRSKVNSKEQLVPNS